jgi:YD repeat-containing protein
VRSIVEATYDLNGRMASSSTTFNLDGQTYSLSMEHDYDSNGRTVATRTSGGTSQSMAYDSLGRITSVTDVLGNVTTYNYDITEVPPPIQACSAFSLQKISSFSSPASAAINSIVTRIDQTILPDNTPNDSSDNPKIIKKYDQNDNLVAEIGATGLENRFVYDELGRLIENIIPDRTPNDWNDNPRLKAIKIYP